MDSGPIPAAVEKDAGLDVTTSVITQYDCLVDIFLIAIRRFLVASIHINTTAILIVSAHWSHIYRTLRVVSKTTPMRTRRSLTI